MNAPKKFKTFVEGNLPAIAITSAVIGASLTYVYYRKEVELTVTQEQLKKMIASTGRITYLTKGLKIVLYNEPPLLTQ